MVGNQIEEGLLRDPGNPSHRDRSPGPLLVAIVLLGVGFGIMSVLDLPVAAEIAIALAVVLALGWGAAVLARRWSSQAASRALQSEIDARSVGAAGIASRIAAARASGAFDRWEARGGRRK